MFSGGRCLFRKTLFVSFLVNFFPASSSAATVQYTCDYLAMKELTLKLEPAVVAN